MNAQYNAKCQNENETSYTHIRCQNCTSYVNTSITFHTNKIEQSMRIDVNSSPGKKKGSERIRIFFQTKTHIFIGQFSELLKVFYSFKILATNQCQRVHICNRDRRDRLFEWNIYIVWEVEFVELIWERERAKKKCKYKHKLNTKSWIYHSICIKKWSTQLSISRNRKRCWRLENQNWLAGKKMTSAKASMGPLKHSEKSKNKTKKNNQRIKFRKDLIQFM